jgi:hypothetical protein
MITNSFRGLRVRRAGIDLVEETYLPARVFTEQEVYRLSIHIVL